jgi:hypothetical protein
MEYTSPCSLILTGPVSAACLSLSSIPGVTSKTNCCVARGVGLAKFLGFEMHQLYVIQNWYMLILRERSKLSTSLLFPEQWMPEQWMPELVFG